MAHRLVMASCLLATLATGSSMLGRRQTSSPTYPTCSLGCLDLTTYMGSCATTDVSCLCQYPTYIDATLECIDNACITPALKLQAGEAARAQCANYGINLATVVQGASSTGAAAGVLTSATPTEAGGAAATSNASGGAPTNVSSSGSSPVGRTSHTGAIVGGIVGGLAALVALLVVLLVLRRQKTKEETTQQLEPTPMAFAPRPGLPQKDSKTPDGNVSQHFIPYAAPAHSSQSHLPTQEPYASPPPARPPPPLSPLTRPAVPPPGAAPPTPNSPSHSAPSPNSPQAPVSAPSTSPVTSISSPMNVMPQPQPAPSQPQLTPEQLALMSRVQSLSAQQLELLERMADNNTNGGSGHLHPSNAVASGSTGQVDGFMDAPPEYDFKTQDP